MPDDSNGIYNVPSGTLVNTGDTVLPSQHNPWATDSSAAISNRFSKDGRSPATGDWDINNFRLKQVGNPTASGDAANKNYVDAQITAVNQNAEKISTQSGNYTALLADKATSFRFTAAATLSLTAAATLGANWWCEVWATNGNVTIDPNGAETINGAATLIVQSGQSAKVFCTGTQFFAGVVSDSFNGPQLQGYYFGLGLTTNATDSANDVDIAVGSAAADTSPYALMQLNTTLTKRIDANWAVGNNQGGLDTGSVSASATYYIWLIQRSDTLVTDVLFSLSSTAPTMPSGYDRKRLIGSLVRTASVNSIPTSKLTGGRQYLGSVTLASAAVDILGIPPGSKSVRLVFEDINTSAAALPLVQLAISSGAVTTGYNAFTSVVSTGGTAASPFNAGFGLNYTAQSTIYQGPLDIIRNAPGLNRWSVVGPIQIGPTAGAEMKGNITLTGELTGVRITTLAGTPILSGSVKIYAEV